MSSASFSYAQAARGQVPPPISNSPLSTQTSTDKADQGSANTQFTASPSSPALAETTKTPARSLYSESGIGQRKVDSDAASAAGSSTLAATLTDSTSNLSLDDTPRNVSVGEKDGHSSPYGTRTSSADDVTGKTRKSKQSKTANGNDQLTTANDEVEQAKDGPKVELAPAPLPTVNIWDQRRKEHAAKAKTTPSTATKPATSSSVPSTPAVNATPAAAHGGSKPKDGKKSASGTTETESNGESNTAPSTGSKLQPKRSGEASRSSNDQPRRSGPRGSRSADKDDKAGTNRESLPSVQDITHWPTPESAAVVDDAKPKVSIEKVDIVDKDSSEDALMSKHRGKKGWTTIEFVPSVSFQTPIPNVRGSKPKTGGRGGRDSTSRGSYNGLTNGTSSSDKNTSSVTPSSDKANFEPQEGSKESSSGSSNRPPTQSTSNISKRFSTDSTHSRELRKSTTAPSDKTKDAAHDYSVASPRTEFVPRGNQNSLVNGDQHHTSHPGQSDRRFPSAARNSEHVTAGRDSGSQQNKEYQGPVSRTDSRPERSSRGGYRGGRGGHTGTSSQNHHLSHSFQSNGQRVGTNANFAGSTSSLPPTAPPYSPVSQQFSYGGIHNLPRPGRNNGRSQSVPHPAPFANRAQNGAVNAPRHHSQSTQAAIGGIPPELTTIPQYPYQPHNPYMDSDLLQGIVTQLDYYFSVENLCKDVFLRRKMDDQGFVPLATVATFNRLASLAPSIEFVRSACEISKNLDFITDADERDLIRSRYHWERFTLMPDERDVEARNVGPDLNLAILRSSHGRPQGSYEQPTVNPGYHALYPGIMAPDGVGVAYSVFDNGMHVDHGQLSNGHASNGHASNGHTSNGRPPTKGSKLSAAVPDFSPSGNNGSVTNLESSLSNSSDQVGRLAAAVTAGTASEITIEESGNVTAAPNGVEGHDKTY